MTKCQQCITTHGYEVHYLSAVSSSQAHLIDAFKLLVAFEVGEALHPIIVMMLANMLDDAETI